ncbi:hypothetical protein [Pedobacter hiemivivus]|uniref:DUF3037 domain-containing protein n=1 Tax=Pedobacter hiemivivus TaxID=2530454 RepID=A0A4R0MIG1_9SPHI|nr:hypothetical protein [Pedobacter hiemivivus]TCC86369.1 hypothetical protein EZ444_24005 [Pedobacter hiemivivus]
MKTLYSIIYVQPNSLTAEKVAVGLMVFAKDKLWFDYEPSKIDLVEKLQASLNLKAHLYQSFKGMKAFIQELNNNKGVNSGMFSEINVFSSDAYAEYLSKYSTGVIHFSGPLPIAGLMDIKLFNNLLEKFIGSKPIKMGFKNTFHNDFKKKINTVNLKDKVDIDFKITPNKIDGIYSETQVRLIGKNGLITAVQDIDFTINPETLGQQLNQWDVLINALNNFSSEKKWPLGDFNVVFNKPEAKSFQEKLLNKIHGQKKGFNLIEINEVDKILKKIEENDYKPLSTLI